METQMISLRHAFWSVKSQKETQEETKQVNENSMREVEKVEILHEVIEAMDEDQESKFASLSKEKTEGNFQT